MFAEKFDKDKYNITEEFMTAKKMNLLLFAVLLPVYTICVCVYLLRWDYANIFMTMFKLTFLLEIFILALGAFAFIAAAMIIKAFLLSAFSEGKSGSLKFKIIKETQKPYCCLTEPVKIRQYQISLAAYIIIGGIAPYVLSFFIGDFIFVLASFLCVFFAGGDILFFLILFREKKKSYVLDFEGIMSYRIYEENTEKEETEETDFS